MNIDKFWQIIADSKLAHPTDPEDQCDALVQHLGELEEAEIGSFQETLNNELDKVCTEPHVSAVCFLLDLRYDFENEAVTDSIQNTFAWLVLQGQARFDAFVSTPDTLANGLEKNEEGEWVCECESLHYVCDNAYEQKTQKDDFFDIYDPWSGFLIEPDFEKLSSASTWAAKYPEIAKSRTK
jgi:hypothetical protein